MSLSPSVSLTGARGRVGQAIRMTLAGEWDLQRYSRTASADGSVQSLEDLLQSAEPLGADLLIHAAWSCVPASAEENHAQIASVDLPLLERIIARLKREPQPPLTLFISTGAVYGLAPADRGSSEDDTPHPLGAYARGKLAAEDLLRASSLPVCILRVGNLYGLPSQPNDRQGVIARLARCAIHGIAFQRWGVNPVKDYLHSDDFFSAMRLIQQRRLTGTWNIGSGLPTSLSDLLQLVEAQTGNPVLIEPRPAPAWDVHDNRLDVTRFSTATGWQPQVTLAEGVAREIAALRGLLIADC